MNKGLIHIYCGNGKGKTTAALGQAFRFIGHNYHVGMLQFMKNCPFTGELESAKKLQSYFDIWQYGPECGYLTESKMNQKKLTECEKCHFTAYHRREETVPIIAEAFQKMKEIVFDSHYKMIVLDEIGIILEYNLVDEKKVLAVLQEKPPALEIILTGRKFSKALMRIADYVSEIKEVKHPYRQKISARKGIEF